MDLGGQIEDRMRQREKHYMVQAEIQGQPV